MMVVGWPSNRALWTSSSGAVPATRCTHPRTSEDAGWVGRSARGRRSSASTYCRSVPGVTSTVWLEDLNCERADAAGSAAPFAADAAADDEALGAVPEAACMLDVLPPPIRLRPYPPAASATTAAATGASTRGDGRRKPRLAVGRPGVVALGELPVPARSGSFLLAASAASTVSSRWATRSGMGGAGTDASRTETPASLSSRAVQRSQLARCALIFAPRRPV